MAQIQVLASWVSPEASILGLQLDTFLLSSASLPSALPHFCVLISSTVRTCAHAKSLQSRLTLQLMD